MFALNNITLSFIMKKPIIVLKFGSSIITQSSGEVNEAIIAQIAQQVSELQKQFHIVLVSSGAVAAGKSAIIDYKGTLLERKAAASVGNPRLISIYSNYFRQYGITIAQSLCERHHFSQRNQFLQLKDTYQELWENNIIPIANENDLVSNLEIKFSDNDELATLIAAGFGAEKLLIATSVGGLLDGNKRIIPQVKEIDSSILSLVSNEKSNTGLGGMISKLTFTKMANRMGLKVVIFGMNEKDAIIKASQEIIGTTFLPQKASLSAKQKWLATGSLISTKIMIDEGAEKALLNRKSLLAVGVKKYFGEFLAGEVIEILNIKKEIIAIAKASHSLENIKAGAKEIAHANDIVNF